MREVVVRGREERGGRWGRSLTDLVNGLMGGWPLFEKDE
jgi:hypothetical protein